MANKKDDVIINALNKIDNKMDNLEQKFAILDKDVTVQGERAVMHGDLLKLTQDHMERISKTLEENTDSLKEHMRRTDLLENSINGLNTRVTPLEDQYRKIAGISWAFAKIAATISTLGGIAYTIVKLLGK